MDASVTLKVSPAEFDRLRAAITVAKEAARADGEDSTLEPQTRRDAKARSLQLSDLLAKLQ